MPENIEIAFPWVFFFAPLPLLVFLVFPALKMKGTALLYPNFKQSQQITGQQATTAALIKRRKILAWFLLPIIWLLLLLTISSPHIVGEPEKKVKTSRSFLILADISFSMAQKDWEIDGKRTSRWEAVKKVMHDFITKREGDRMGLVFFGSAAYIQAPFTSDLKTVELMLEEADVGMAGQMTNIGKAVVKGIEMFERDTFPTKVMLLLTDGVDAGTEILPLDAADLAKQDSILIYTIGIGNPEARNSDLDETTLKEMSAMTGAQYFRAIDAIDLNKVYSVLDELEPIEYEEEELKPITHLYPYPLFAALALILLFNLVYSIVALVNSIQNKYS